MANWAKQQRERVGLPIRKLAEHGIHFVRPDGLSEFHCVGSRAHFPDASAQFGWSEIDTTLKTVGAEYGAPGLPIRFRLDGRVAVGMHVQQTTRIGLFHPTTRAFSLLATLPSGLISDDKIIRESEIFREEITLKESGVREELIVASMPSGGAGDWLVLETRIQGGDFADGETTEFSREGYRFSRPSARDANRKELQAKRFAVKRGAAQFLLTGVSFAALAQAQFPVVIDPDFSSNTNDGYVRGLNAAYATARSTSTNFASGTEAILGQWFAGADYRIYRAFLQFDTSSIGSASTVTQANLKLTATIEDPSDTDFDVKIMKQDWSGQSPLSDANRETAYDNCLAGTLDDNIWRNTSGMSINTQYTSGNLATAYVSKTSTTYYSLISGRDIAGTTPTGQEYIYVAFFDHATSAYRPVLTVVYTSGGAAYSFGVVMG